MFGSMIYYDDKRISEYSAIARGTKNIKIEKMNISDGKDVGLDISIIGGGLKHSRSYEATVEESVLFDCIKFEGLLSGRDDYFDFTEHKYDLATIGRGNIIKFDGIVTVPNAFDLTQTISQFMPYIKSAMAIDMDKNRKLALDIFLTANNPKIPIISECQDCVLCSKIESKYLKVELSQLEEIENTDATMLARIVSNNLISKEKPIYDPLKDFISLNRTLRRSLDEKRTEALQMLYADDEYRRVEILAIYQ